MSVPVFKASLLESAGNAVGVSVFKTALSMIVNLVDPDQVERLPVQRTEGLLGCRISSILLAPFQASATAKIKMALRLPNEESAE